MVPAKASTESSFGCARRRDTNSGCDWCCNFTHAKRGLDSHLTGDNQCCQWLKVTRPRRSQALMPACFAVLVVLGGHVRFKKGSRKDWFFNLLLAKKAFLFQHLLSPAQLDYIGFERSVTFLIPKHPRKCAKGRRCSLVFRAALREPMSSVLFCFAHVAHCRRGWLQLP